MTELERLLVELEALGEAGQRAAEAMRKPIREADMEAVVNAIS